MIHISTREEGSAPKGGDDYPLSEIEEGRNNERRPGFAV
jgi:hypothetical protein